MPQADLLLLNARVVAMDRTTSRVQAVAVGQGKILAVGGNSEVKRLVSGNPRVIDCQGLALLPGFIDGHCHLPAMARAALDLDCGPERASSIPQLQQLLRDQARKTKPGGWVRGHSYDDLSLAESRHPTRWDLDQAAPNHPVRLDHRSGHAVVLNSLALRLAGIHRETTDPSGGTVHRHERNGEPTGVLFEMAAFLRERLGGLRAAEEFDNGMRAVSQRLLGYGITSAQDAGAHNGPERWETFRRLQGMNPTFPRILMMTGYGKLPELAEAGLSFRSGTGRLRVGHAKIMLTLTSGRMHPSTEELRLLVAYAHSSGFPVAIHAVEEEAVAAAAAILKDAGGPRPAGLPRDRIEHCAEGPSTLVERVLASGAFVVTQPGFLYWNGPDYRERVPERLHAHLYPAAALHRAGVPVAFGSDAPVIDPNPWPAIYTAVTGLTRDGRPLADSAVTVRTIPVATAIRMYTLAAAEAEGTAADKGSITPGKLADLVLVDADPTSVEPQALKSITASLTVLGGVVVSVDH